MPSPTSTANLQLYGHFVPIPEGTLTYFFAPIWEARMAGKIALQENILGIFPQLQDLRLKIFSLS